MNKYEGIVLKHTIHKNNRISLFDKKMGKIEGIVSKKNAQSIRGLHYGAHVHYSILGQSTLFIEDLEIIHLPLELAMHDIEFLHQIIELCNFYLTEENNLHDLFEHFIHLLHMKQALSIAQKQLFLCIFFAHIGIYPDDPPFQIEEFKKSDKVILQKKLDELGVTVIQSWILACINMHPNKHKFKTIHTLDTKK